MIGQGDTGDPTRLPRAQAAASRFVKYDIENNTPLGVVTFSGSATTELPVDRVTDANRDSIVEKINNITADGVTCIDLGLAEGLGALKTYDNKTGGVMILLTDGGYNCHDDKTWLTFESDLA